MSRTLTHAAATSALALSLGLAASLPAMAAEAMRVVKDPVSGELRPPTAAEAAAFDKAQAALGVRSKGQPQAPVEIHHPDGSVETKLGEDSRMYSVVSSNADGSLVFDCLPAQEAQKFVKGKKPLPSKTAAAKAGHDDHQH